MAGKKNPKEAIAEQYYFDTDFTQEEIADLLEVTPQTVSRWATEGNWKAKKASYKITPRDLEQMYSEQIFEIRDVARNQGRPLNAKEADAISKLSASIERVRNKVSISIVIGVFMEFNNWLRPIDLELLKQLSKYQREYLSTRND